jgi:hypothetical protein
VIYACWHAIIGSSLINDSATTEQQRSIDRYGLYSFAGVFLFFNVFYICWFIYMARRNKIMLNNGKKEYEDILESRKKEFELKDKELADKEQDYDEMEKDREVEEIIEKANSFQANMKEQNPKVSKKNKNSQGAGGRNGRGFKGNDDGNMGNAELGGGGGGGGG